jgi:hypothetical protein
VEITREERSGPRAVYTKNSMCVSCGSTDRPSSCGCSLRSLCWTQPDAILCEGSHSARPHVQRPTLPTASIANGQQNKPCIERSFSSQNSTPVTGQCVQGHICPIHLAKGTASIICPIRLAKSTASMVTPRGGGDGGFPTCRETRTSPQGLQDMRVWSRTFSLLLSGRV